MITNLKEQRVVGTYLCLLKCPSVGIGTEILISCLWNKAISHTASI